MKKILSVFLVLICLCSVVVLPTDALVVNSNTIDQVVQWAIDTANDDTHGYSQAYNRRWGNPDYDCASFVICAYRSVGFKLPNAAHCSNIKEEFMKEGFQWIPNTEIDLSTSKYLKPGDVLLRIAGHTEIYIGDNKQCGAHDDYDGNKPGDTYGDEVCPYTYSNRSNWSGILRYPTEKHVDVGTDFYAYIKNNKTGKLLTNDNRNVSVRTETGESNQVWKFERQSDGAYIIRTCFDNKVLNVSYSGTTPGTNVGVYKNTDSPAKRWFVYGKKNKYRFKPKCADLALDAYGGTETSEDGLNVCLWTDDGTSTQYFSIIKLEPPAQSYIECRPGTSTSPTSIWWNMTLYTTAYDLKIYDSNGEVFKEMNDLTDTNCQITLPAGNYQAVVYSKNSFTSTQSMNAVTFTVEQGELLGDVDLDGEISVIDATDIQMHMAKMKTLSDEQIFIGDTDKDGELSVLDATAIQRYIAKLITEF